MQGNIYREVFPTFLAKKSYGWWITRRRMEIYTKIFEEKISCGVGRTKEILHQRRMGWCEFRTRGRCCAKFAQAWAVVRNSHMLGAVVFRRPYLPHFSSKSYTVWSFGFLTSRSLKWYIACRKWTSGSAPKVQRKTTAAVLYFLHSVFLSFSSLPLSFTWLVLMIQKAVKTLKLATNMIRSHC